MRFSMPVKTTPGRWAAASRYSVVSCAPTDTPNAPQITSRWTAFGANAAMPPYRERWHSSVGKIWTSPAKRIIRYNSGSALYNKIERLTARFIDSMRQGSMCCACSLWCVSMCCVRVFVPRKGMERGRICTFPVYLLAENIPAGGSDSECMRLVKMMRNCTFRQRNVSSHWRERVGL